MSRAPLGLLIVLVALGLLSSTAGIAKSPTGRQGGDENLAIVYFDEAPLARYAGELPGLAATSPEALGASKLDAGSAAAKAYLTFLDQRQTLHLERIGQALGRAVAPVFRYRALANGVAVVMSPSEARRVARLPGVRKVIRDRLEYVDTDRGPTWIGAPGIWDGSETAGAGATHGEGIVVGIFDTGINMDHPSFAATGGDSYTHTNPNGSGNYLGWCDPGHPNHDPSYVCNHKLIGAWDYSDAYCTANPGTCAESDGPEDDDGHGSHTASTTAGNILPDPGVSGVAPHANIVAYDVCYVDPGSGQGTCPFSATSAAVDQSVLDGVDATNYSIGGGGDPWGGDIDTFFLDAVAAGVFPAASAGNSGPAAGTVAHLGPWVATAAASTHDRDSIENDLSNMSGGLAPPADITGASRTLGYGPAPIVYAGDYSNGDVDPEQCLNPFPPGTWTNEIVVCDRGTIARVLKCANVADGGAAGCVLANAVASQGAPVPDPHVIPATHIDLANGDTVRAWLATGVGHMATLTDSVISLDPALADIMGDFSSRGPNTEFDSLKPDVAAPGVSIFAAVNSDPGLPSPEFGTLSGTSMASPHVAGSGALLSALFPSWSPSQIKSALVMSADTSMFKEDGITTADTFDFGGGRVDLGRASRVGLVMDETASNYLAADPSEGGSPSSLNVPNAQLGSCVLGCTFSRTFESVAGGSVTWDAAQAAFGGGMTISADPDNFTIAPGATQTVEFTVDVVGQPLDVWQHGFVILSEALLSSQESLQMPVAVRPASENLPESFTVESIYFHGSAELQDLASSSAITDLSLETFGLVPATQTEISLDEDPTNGDAFDDLGQVFSKTLSVPVGARRLAVRTSSEEAPDVDLFVGTGATPSAATQVCASTTPTATEVCDLADPAPGTYWIVVQNWQGSDDQPDLIHLLDGVVSTDAGNMTASGPSAVSAGDPFTITLEWDEPAFQGGSTWFGVLDVGSSPGTPQDIETVSINLINPALFADGFETGNTTRW